MTRAKDGRIWAGHVKISEGFVKALRDERERTGLSPSAVLRGAADKPALLSAEMVANWMTGQTKTASPDHMAFVIAAYRKARTRRRG